MGTPQDILLVEDDKAFRRSLRRHLVTRNHRVHEAGSVSEALALIATVSAQTLVLTDLCLSDGSGLSVISAAEEAGMSVLAMTAATHLPNEARNRGALACLPKPFPLSLLDEWLVRLQERATKIP